jgi:transcriptional regulator with XRE-family HTH domain
MDVGRKVRRIRRVQDLSQDDLASRVGVSRNTISRFETGARMPSIVMLEKLADALGVKGADLLAEGSAELMREPAVPLAEAPETGRPERKASASDVALLAGRAQVAEDRKTFARAAASESAQGSFVPHLNDAMRRLREEYPAADLAEACVDLAHRCAEKEQENRRLIEALEQHQRETARQ